MRCYHVLVHGTLSWDSKDRAGVEIDVVQPAGFYCHRYLLAADEDEARVRAFCRVSDNLDRQFGWLSSDAASIDLEAEEVSIAPIHKVFKPDNKGHSFYTDK